MTSQPFRSEPIDAGCAQIKKESMYKVETMCCLTMFCVWFCHHTHVLTRPWQFADTAYFWRQL
jgi:hypothetical protein